MVRKRCVVFVRICSAACWLVVMYRVTLTFLFKIILKWKHPQALRFKYINITTYFLTYLLNVLSYLLIYLVAYFRTYIHTYLPTYLFSQWSRVLPEKLTGRQLVKKFPSFYGILRFTTAFTKPAIYPYPEPDRCSPCPTHFSNIRFNIILPSTFWSSKLFLSLRFL